MEKMTDTKRKTKVEDIDSYEENLKDFFVLWMQKSSAANEKNCFFIDSTDY